MAQEYRTYSPAYCFGCGAENPIGLHLDIEFEEGGVARALFTPQRPHSGYPNMVHGGIVATLLDEVLAQAVYNEREGAVTAKMETTFRRPLEPGETVEVRGWVESSRGRRIVSRGEIRRAEDGALIAEARGVFMSLRGGDTPGQG
ncbi:MAG: PaaI family thioesterase [Rubrobacteraceae bacterium]|nr:PaaI family thioesterase [Rubrobacteraceae bacterium]